MWRWRTIAEEPEEIAYAMAELVEERPYVRLGSGKPAVGRSRNRAELFKMGGDKYGEDLVRRADRDLDTAKEDAALAKYVDALRDEAKKRVESGEVGNRPR